MGFEDLPKRIQYEIMNKDGEGNDKNDKDAYYDRKDNELHITELLYCLTKSFYSRKEPVEPNLKQAFPLYRGNLLDNRFTSLFRLNQIRCTHRVPDIPCTIVGKCDFIDDDGTLCDLKTATNLFYTKKDGGAKDEHCKQVQFYCYCNAIDKAKVIYFDFGDTVTYPVEIGDATLLIRELEEKARILYKALITNKPPERNIKGKEWMCASTDWRTGKIKKKEDGSDAINCPYFFKCYSTVEDFYSSMNMKVAPVEEKTAKFSPEPNAPVITVATKNKGK
jgi:hypothetical protein